MLYLCFLGHPGTKGIGSIDICYVLPFVIYLPLFHIILRRREPSEIKGCMFQQISF